MEDAHISFVLDMSGSMAHLEGATIQSFNNFMKEQRETPGKTYVSLTLFDTTLSTPLVGYDINDVPEMSTNGVLAYHAGGGTALYDAVCVSIKGAEKWKEKHGFSGKMVVVIQTDGQENSSKEWTIDMLNDLIKYKRGEGWEFIFMGTGQSAWLESKKFSSIDPNMIVHTGATHQGYVGGQSMANSSILRGRATGSYTVTEADKDAWDTSK